MTVLSQAAIDAATELQQIRRQSSQIRKREEQLKELIYGELGSEPKGLLASGVPIVHVEIQHRRTVNAPKLEAMYPEVFEAVLEEKETRVLKIDL